MMDLSLYLYFISCCTFKFHSSLIFRVISIQIINRSNYVVPTNPLFIKLNALKLYDVVEFKTCTKHTITNFATVSRSCSKGERIFECLINAFLAMKAGCRARDLFSFNSQHRKQSKLKYKSYLGHRQPVTSENPALASSTSNKLAAAVRRAFHTF